MRLEYRNRTILFIKHLLCWLLKAAFNSGYRWKSVLQGRTKSAAGEVHYVFCYCLLWGKSDSRRKLLSVASAEKSGKRVGCKRNLSIQNGLTFFPYLRKAN